MYNELIAPPSGIFVQVSCGHMHSCAVGIDETVKCWGMVEGKLGIDEGNEDIKRKGDAFFSS
jgi:hypothetical protein